MRIYIFILVLVSSTHVSNCITLYLCFKYGSGAQKKFPYLKRKKLKTTFYLQSKKLSYESWRIVVFKFKTAVYTVRTNYDGNCVLKSQHLKFKTFLHRYNEYPYLKLKPIFICSAKSSHMRAGGSLYSNLKLRYIQYAQIMMEIAF